MGGLLASPKLGGGKWWWRSMGRKKGGGAPGLELVHMGWVFGGSLATNGIVSLVTSSLFRGMALELAFGRKSVWRFASYGGVSGLV
jgi:hypothetical protein